MLTEAPLPPPHKTWIRTLTASLTLQSQNLSHPFHADPYALHSVTVQSYDLFGGGKRLGFLKLTSEVSNSAGERLPGAVFLRGPSVAMLVVLVPDDADLSGDGDPYAERYALMTVQARVAAGSLAFAEIPAGMVDEEGQFAGTAAREIKEELGLEIPADQLICLSDLAASSSSSSSSLSPQGRARGGQDTQVDESLPHGVFPSPGGCDEHVPIYLHERRVPRAQLGEWTGRLTGERAHGEKITLRLVALRDLWREGARDAKALAALALWEGLRREGTL